MYQIKYNPLLLLQSKLARDRNIVNGGGSKSSDGVGAVMKEKSDRLIEWSIDD